MLIILAIKRLSQASGFSEFDFKIVELILLYQKSIYSPSLPLFMMCWGGVLCTYKKEKVIFAPSHKNST